MTKQPKYDRSENINMIITGLKSLNLSLIFQRILNKEKFLIPLEIIDFTEFDFTVKKKFILSSSNNLTSKDYDNLTLLIKENIYDNEYINKFYVNYQDNAFLQIVLLSNFYKILISPILTNIVTGTKTTTKDFFSLLCLICSDFPKTIYEQINMLHNITLEQTDLLVETAVPLNDFFDFFMVHFLNKTFVDDFLSNFNIELSKDKILNFDCTIGLSYDSLIKYMDKLTISDDLSRYIKIILEVRSVLSVLIHKHPFLNR